MRSKRHRDLLLAFSVRARGCTGGISAEDYEELTGGLADLPNDSPESSLLPFLSADEVGLRRYSTEQHQQLLHILGTKAPACQLLKPVAFAIVLRISDGDMAALRLDMIKPFGGQMPTSVGLFAAIHGDGRSALPCHLPTSSSAQGILLCVLSGTYSSWQSMCFLALCFCPALSSSACTGGHASV